MSTATPSVSPWYGVHTFSDPRRATAFLESVPYFFGGYQFRAEVTQEGWIKVSSDRESERLRDFTTGWESGYLAGGSPQMSHSRTREPLPAILRRDELLIERMGDSWVIIDGPTEQVWTVSRGMTEALQCDLDAWLVDEQPFELAWLVLWQREYCEATRGNGRGVTTWHEAHLEGIVQLQLSVGHRCWVLLGEGMDAFDDLFPKDAEEKLELWAREGCPQRGPV